QLADGGQDPRARQRAARDGLAQLDVARGPGALDRREAGEQRHVGVLGAVKDFLRRGSGPGRVAAVLVEVPRDVRGDIDHAGQHRQLSEIVCGVRASGLDPRDFGSLHHDRRVAQRLAGAVDDGGGMNPDGLALRGERRGGQNCGKQSGFHSHGADYNPRTLAMLKVACAALLTAGAIVLAPDTRTVEWPYYGGDPAGTKYSALDEVNRTNVSKLRVAWEWRTGEKARPEFGTRPGNFQATPLMIGGVLYLSTPYNRVVALNAETGRELWAHHPKPYEDRQ